MNWTLHPLSLLALLAAPLNVPGALPGAAPAVRPNIVVVLLEDQRWDDLGYAGHPFVRTPNLDRMAAAGAIFKNAFVTTPESRASRHGFFTGRHALGGDLDLTAASAAAAVPFPRQLRDSGYRTAFIGRSHFSASDLGRAGFDALVTLGLGGYEDPQLTIEGRTRKETGYVTDILVRHTVEFLQQASGAPFCVVLSHHAVADRAEPGFSAGGHGPLTTRGAVPAPRHGRLYEGMTPPRRPNHAQPIDKPALARGPNAFASDDEIRNRLRVLTAVDEGMGRILEVLEKTGKLEDTVIVFASDGGYLYGEHGTAANAQLPYDESIRIPLLVVYPRVVRPGLALSQLVLNLDIAPTLLELVGAKSPAAMHGRSLVPLFSGHDPERRVLFLVESTTHPAQPDAPQLKYEAIRMLRLKYVRYPELGGAEEFYDIDADPYEMINMAGRDSTRGEIQGIRARLEKLLREHK